jgi:hemerythrin-like domain-containing protein
MLSENLSNQEWSANAKVLAELVEQHLDEEENEVFPYLKRHLDSDTDAELCFRYESQHHDSDSDSYEDEYQSDAPRWS